MNRIKGCAIWQTNKNDVQTHKSQRFSGELGFNYEPDEHHSFGLRYMPETGIGNADRNSSGKTVTRRNDEETDRINFTTAEQIHTGWDHAANAYYAGELGKWNIDFNADYLFKRSHSDQNAMNNDDATVQADSRMRSSLYAAKLVVSAPLWNGRFHSVRKKLLPTAMISLPKTVSLPMPTTTSNNPYMPHLLTIQNPSAIGN